VDHYQETRGTALDEIKRRRRRRQILNGLVGVALLALAAGLFLMWRGEGTSPAPEPIAGPVEPRAVTPPETPKPAPAPQSPVVAEPPVPSLPGLEESDTFVRERAQKLSPSSALAAWLVDPDLVRRFVAAVDNVAEGKTPREHLSPLRIDGPFRTEERDDRLTIAPVSFERYDLVTKVFVSLDVEATASLYRLLRPLIDEAYSDLGYPQVRFDDTLTRAIAELLRAPVIVGEPEMTPRIISQAYLDPELEDLSGAQKQLLRLGPANASRVQRKLRELALAIGMAESALPRTRFYRAPAPGQGRRTLEDVEVFD